MWCFSAKLLAVCLTSWVHCKAEGQLNRLWDCTLCHLTFTQLVQTDCRQQQQTASVGSLNAFRQVFKHGWLLASPCGWARRPGSVPCPAYGFEVNTSSLTTRLHWHFGTASLLLVASSLLQGLHNRQRCPAHFEVFQVLVRYGRPVDNICQFVHALHHFFWKRRLTEDLVCLAVLHHLGHCAIRHLKKFCRLSRSGQKMFKWLITACLLAVHALPAALLSLCNADVLKWTKEWFIALSEIFFYLPILKTKAMVI